MHNFSKWNSLSFFILLLLLSLFINIIIIVSSVKWSVLAHLKFQPRGQNFQAQKPVERSSPKTLEPTKMPKTLLK